jgi:serine/threonine protein kinase/WD40 repeat protein
MKLRIACTNPTCGKSGSVPAELLGKTVRCPLCGESILVSDSSAVFEGLPSVSTSSPTAQSTKLDQVTVDSQQRNSGAKLSRPEAQTEEKLGRFKIRTELGAGAFGRVYRAYDPQLDREVALKVPHPELHKNPQRVERFVREARAAAQLRHPNLVPVFESGMADGRPYIASAYITGKPLDEELEESRIKIKRAVEIIRRLAEGLAYAHQKGVVHRDVKPANVIIDNNGQPLLADFGLASRKDDAARVTSDGMVLGTPSYMAPEQAAGQQGEAQPAADQYSLGVMLYEMLTGQTPFSGPPAVVIHNQIHGTPELPRKINRSIPRDLETICMKAMAKLPDDRYPDCQEMADDLRRWQEGEPILARRLGLIERTIRWTKREPKLAVALGALLISLLTIGVLLIFKNTELIRELRYLVVEKSALQEEIEAEKNSSEKLKEEQLGDRLMIGQAKANAGDGEGVAKLIAEVPADRQGPDWDFLKARVNQTPEFYRTFYQKPDRDKFGHTFGLFFRPDHSQLLGFHTNRGVTGWNPKTGRATPFPELPPEVRFDLKPNEISLNADGSRVAVAQIETRNFDANKKELPLRFVVKVFDSSTGKFVGPEIRIEGFWPTIAISPDGEKIAIAYATIGKPHALTLWEVATGAAITGMTKAIAQLPFKDVLLNYAPNGESIAATTIKENGEIRLWSVSTGEELIAIENIGVVSKIAISPDGLRVAAVGGAEVQHHDEEYTETRIVPVVKSGTRVVCKVVTTSEERVLKDKEGDICKVVINVPKQITVLETYSYTSYENVTRFSVAGPWLSAQKSEYVFTVMETKTVTENVQISKEIQIIPKGTKIKNGITVPCECPPEKQLITEVVPVSKTVCVPKTQSHSSRKNHGLVRIWDQPTATLTFHVDEPEEVQTIAWRIDGLRLAAATKGALPGILECEKPNYGQDCEYSDRSKSLLVKIWHSRTTQVMTWLDSSDVNYPVTALAISSDGKQVAVGFANWQHVITWSAQKSQLVANLKGQEGAITDLAFSRDSKLLASFSRCNQTTKVWDGHTLGLIGSVTPTDVFARFTEDKKLLTGAGSSNLPKFRFAGFRDGVRIWNPATLTPEWKNQPNALAISDDGDLVVTGKSLPGQASSVELRNARTGAPISNLEKAIPLQDFQSGWLIVPGGEYVAQFHKSSSNVLNLWKADSGKLKLNLGEVRSASFSVDGKRLFVIKRKPEPALVEINLRNVAESKSILLKPELVEQATDLSLLENNRVLIHTSDSIRVWDLMADKEIANLSVIDQIFGIGQNTSILAVFQGQRIPQRDPFGNPISRVTNPTIQVLDLWNGKPVSTIQVPGAYVRSIDFSKDGTRLAFAGTSSNNQDGMAEVADVKSGKRIASYVGHKATVNKVLFRPDDQAIASAGADRSIKLWQLPESNVEPLEDLPVPPGEPQIIPPGPFPTPMPIMAAPVPQVLPPIPIEPKQPAKVK